ncbi:MAG: hypothetical protein ACP5LM_04190 [Thermoplasmata archaeon]
MRNLKSHTNFKTDKVGLFIGKSLDELLAATNIETVYKLTKQGMYIIEEGVLTQSPRGKRPDLLNKLIKISKIITDEVKQKQNKIATKSKKKTKLVNKPDEEKLAKKKAKSEDDELEKLASINLDESTDEFEDEEENLEISEDDLSELDQEEKSDESTDDNEEISETDADLNIDDFPDDADSELENEDADEFEELSNKPTKK